jgi:hypothetical protein
LAPYVHVPQQITSPHTFAVVRKFIYNGLYLPHRSGISLFIGFIRGYKRFTCSCCILELGGQDLDREYATICQCCRNNFISSNNDNHHDDPRYCRYCVSSYLTTQIVENHAYAPVCMDRKCVLDDRFVRQRLAPDSERILDRQQILHAASDLTTTRNNEKLWHCPSRDCSFVAFIVNNNDKRPPWRFSLRSIMGNSSDERRIKCPICQISSCVYCGNIWTQGNADHTYITCEKYARSLETGTNTFDSWKKKRDVQVCPAPNCNFLIEKNSGCNHMTCRCGYEFCWICGHSWSREHYTCRNYRQRMSSQNEFNPNQLLEWVTSWFR